MDSYFNLPINIGRELAFKGPRYLVGYMKDLMKKADDKLSFPALRGRQKTLSKMDLTPNIKLRAKYAKNAYLDLEHRPYHMEGGYKYLPNLSNKYHSVYINPDEKKMLYNVRGTNPGGWRDIASDIFILDRSLEKNERWHEEKNNMEKMIKDFGKKYKFELTGHSLGGKIVTHLMGIPSIASHVIRADAYNPGQASTDSEMEELVDPGSKFQVHLARSDPLSESYSYEVGAIGDLNYYEFDNIGPFEAHSLINFM